MVRNLYIENSAPLRPILLARNSEGPGESSLIAVAMRSIAGSITMPSAIPNVTSSERLTTRAAPAVRLESFRDLGSIAAGNARPLFHFDHRHPQTFELW